LFLKKIIYPAKLFKFFVYSHVHFKKTKMKTTQGYYVDVVNSEISSAYIAFDTHIRSIDRLPDAPDVYILPGLVDAHVHIESSMLTPSEFAGLDIQHGALAAVCDPHELANVLGNAGIDFILEDAARISLRFFSEHLFLFLLLCSNQQKLV